MGYLPTAAGRWSGATLRRCTGMRYTDLDPLLAELAREGRIRIDPRYSKLEIASQNSRRSRPPELSYYPLLRLRKSHWLLL
jgi:hypothetical protein